MGTISLATQDRRGVEANQLAQRQYASQSRDRCRNPENHRQENQARFRHDRKDAFSHHAREKLTRDVTGAAAQQG